MPIVPMQGEAKIHYKAGKNITIAGELRRKGELVPEAQSWKPEAVAKLQRTGHLQVDQVEVEAAGAPKEGALSVASRKKKEDVK